jgi:hypothetical protein
VVCLIAEVSKCFVYAFTNLLSAQLPFPLELIREQRFVNTNCTMRGVIVVETTVKTLMAHAAIAVAIAGHLLERYRNLAGRALGIAS